MRVSISLALIALIPGCSPQSQDTPQATPESDARPAPSQAEFMDRVWRVVESPQVEEGSVRIFLEGGTLVMDSPHAEPAFGRWTMEDDNLVISEDGIRYPVEIVTLTDQTFRILLRGPGDPVDIRFERADVEARVLFEARGHEPGWFLELVQDRWIHLVYDYGEAEAHVPVPEPTVDPATGMMAYHARTDDIELTLTIEPSTCSAPGSGEPRPSTVTVEVDGRVLSGCGGSLPGSP